MSMKKNGMAWTLVLTLMIASLAGCLGGDDDEEVEEKTINIAGSSTVFPVASAWGQAYSEANSDYTVTVAGGGSGAGASKVCSTDSDSVHIGDMSRDWKSSEAEAGEDGFTFKCLDSDITVTQLIVAIDGLSVVVKKGGAADQCITEMGGLSMAQLRWIFTDWSEEDLAADGLDMDSVTPNNDDDGVREWGDLDASCADSEIKLWGADSDSGTYEYFGEQVFCKDCFADADPVSESFDTARGYQNSADDNQIVNGITGDENAIGYFGYAYYEENANSLSVAAIANDDFKGVQDAGGAVTPEESTVADGSYAPLSRYIYMNVNNDEWDLVTGFIEYGYSDEGMDHVSEVGYVALPASMISDMKSRIGGADFVQADDDDDTPQGGTINIAGSSTVFPVASAWGQAFSNANSAYTVTVAGGGSGAGASKVCSTDTDSVHIGDMSRGWKSSEADAGTDGYTYKCLDSDITVTQLVVAIDGLSVVVKKGGAADQCITSLGGLSMAQLRWIYSDWTESELEADGLIMSSVTPNNDNDGVREWSDLSDSGACADSEIKLWGADSDSGTYEYFGEQVFCKNCFAGKEGYTPEGFDSARGYQNSADDNQIVNGITGDENAIGYFGYAYYEENANTLSVAAIANDDYHGVQDAGNAVTPEASTVADGSYAPLSRFIYMNVNNDEWPLVTPFIEYGFSDAGMEHVMDVGYVALPQAMIDDMVSRIGGNTYTAVVAGCTDSGADNYDSSANTDDGSCKTTATSGTINIAGSSTVFPVASAWGQAFSNANSGFTVTVAGGGSGAGASKVCSTDTDSVHIGDMSRGWKDSEATVGEDGYTYSCLNSDITVTQLIVAIDGLSVVVKKGGAADQCITSMGGLSMGQLRWIYTDWTESELEADGLVMSSITPNNDDDGVREWSDLSASGACADSEIKLWGADSDSGTYEYFGEQVFCKNCFAGKEGYTPEGFDSVRGYQNSADDNQIVNGIQSDENAIGYFGYAYYEENANTLSVAAIANNDTHGVADAGGAVTPEASTVADGSYAPLSRYIYMNVNNDDWDLVRGFIEYGYSDAGMEHVMDVGYVALPQAMIDEMVARIG
jgi:phosphate transport system substrate-binding protein